MKKIIFILAITFIALTLNAQWFLGGKLGLNITEENVTGGNKTYVGFSIAPKWGYYFNEKFALGLNTSIGTNFNLLTSDGYNSVKSVDITVPWNISPFVRFHAFTYKKLALILEGSIGIGAQHRLSKTGSNDMKVSPVTIGIGVFNITPVLGYKLTDHLQLEAGLNFLNLGYNIDVTVDVENTTKTNPVKHNFNFGFYSTSILSVSQLTIGAIYKF